MVIIIIAIYVFTFGKEQTSNNSQKYCFVSLFLQGLTFLEDKEISIVLLALQNFFFFVIALFSLRVYFNQ